jgi:hypothetical protein
MTMLNAHTPLGVHYTCLEIFLTKFAQALVPSFKSSWRGWIGQLPCLAAQGLSEVVNVEAL